MPPCGGHPVLLREGIDPLAFQVVPPCGGHRGSCRPPPWVLPFQVVPPCGGHLVKAACLASGPGVSSRAPVWGASWPGWRPSGRPISFKSCPRVGGIITKDYHQLWGWRCFKSCPRVGGIGSYWQQCISGVRFKSCPRVGGIAAFAPLWQTTEVSSRAPVWGASAVESGSSVREKFQVVPPCGGHPRSRSASGSRAVSSRAPVWGASSAMDRINMILQVSSRAPVWGASLFSAQLMPLNGFQVVPPCGGHPPPPPPRRSGSSFKSCPRVGGIRSCQRSQWYQRCFKSCPRVGGIFELDSDFWGSNGFKSCPRVGGIHLPPPPFGFIKVSSRAPVWGASTAG